MAPFRTSLDKTLYSPRHVTGLGRVELVFEDWLEFTMEPMQIYGLFFILGSYSVATLSDLKRMSAQSEFVSVWAIIAIALFVVDVYLVGTDKMDMNMFIVKWLLIVGFSILCHEKVGVIFHLATGDVVAMMAVVALLGPVGVIFFYVIVKVVDIITRPIWRQFGTETAYPFMPVIFLTTLIVLALAWVLSEQVG